MSIWLNKSEENLSKAQIEEILNKWVEILDLDSSKLRPIGVEKQIKSYSTHSANATVYWDHDECIWKLTLYQSVSERDIIHELGHVKLESALNFRSDISKDEDESLILCLKLLMDSIVNYTLSKNEIFYNLNKKQLVSDMNVKIQKNKLNKIQFIAIYLRYYIELKYFLRAEDYKKNKNKIHNFLYTIKKGIEGDLSKNDGILINFKIQELKKELDKFELIKDLSDFKKIKELFKDILLKLNIWHPNYIHNILAKIFKPYLKKCYYSIKLDTKTLIQERRNILSKNGGNKK